MKSIKIKNKDYVTVSERIKYFREENKYKGYSLISEIIHIDDTTCIVKAVIADENGKIVATGLAREDKNNKLSMVNQTSFVENCETSAWGRALANLGIGIDASIASAEEVVTAIAQQVENEQVSEYERKHLFNIAKGKEHVLKDILKKYGYEDTKTITKKDFKKIAQEVELLTQEIREVVVE